MGHFLDSRRKRSRHAAWAAWTVFAACWACAWPAVAGRSLFVGNLYATLLVMGSWWLLAPPTRRRIPVLNYHSVSPEPGWLELGDRVSLHPETFDRQLAYLKRHGYETLFVSELHARLKAGRPLDPRERYVAITFDDGYADNWLAAFPLLEKHGLKATVFVSADFVDPREGVRPRAGTGGAGGAADWRGYLRWDELRAMQSSGRVEIQSHGQAHTRRFRCDRLRGFVAPGRPNLWIQWNRSPGMKPRWWQHYRADRSTWGHPVFAQGPALAGREYRPDPAAVERLLATVRAEGAGFFRRPQWEAILREQWERDGRAASRWESEEEYVGRVRRDVLEARQALAARLGRPVRFLCWPENAWSEPAERAARAAGYEATVANSHETANLPGENPDRITRVFIGAGRFGLRGPRLDTLAFVLTVKLVEGNYLGYPLLLAAALLRRAAGLFARRTPCRNDYLAAWA